MSLINEPTLVLNKSWLATDSITVKKAFTKVISGRAVFLDTVYWSQHDIYSWIKLPVLPGKRFIRMSCGEIRIPELVLTTKYNRIPNRQVVFNRRNIWKRDKGVCQYCGKKPPSDETSIDHIVPRSKGGLSTFPNCVLACMKCNCRKGSHTLKEVGMKLIHGKVLPRPKWSPLYALKRKKYPDSWKTFLKDFDEQLYWEVELED